MLVVALDPPFGPAGGLNYRDVVKATSLYAAAFKIGLPFLLEYGVDGIRALRGMVEKTINSGFQARRHSGRHDLHTTEANGS